MKINNCWIRPFSRIQIGSCVFVCCMFFFVWVWSNINQSKKLYAGKREEIFYIMKKLFGENKVNFYDRKFKEYCMVFFYCIHLTMKTPLLGWERLGVSAGSRVTVQPLVRPRYNAVGKERGGLFLNRPPTHKTFYC